MRKMKQSGVSLIEVLVAMFMVSSLVVALTGLITLGTRSALVNEQRTVAQGLATREMEKLRALAYDEVGYDDLTEPDGILPASQTVTQNDQAYEIRYEIKLVDDEANGTVSGTLDESNADYKEVVIRVLTPSISGIQRDVLLTTIVAPGVEPVGGGSGGDPEITGLIHRWKLDESSGTTAVDSTGGFDAAYQGVPVSSSDTAPTPGTNERSIVLDGAGSGDYLWWNGDDPITGRSEMTVSVWVKSVTQQTMMILGNQYGNCSSCYNFYLLAYSAGVQMVLQTGSGTVSAAGSPSVLDGSWHHIVATYNGSESRLYVDGIQRASSSGGSGPISQNSPESFTIGAVNPNYLSSFLWNGQIDDVHIYDRVLSQEEISSLISG